MLAVFTLSSCQHDTPLTDIQPPKKEAHKEADPTDNKEENKDTDNSDTNNPSNQGDTVIRLTDNTYFRAFDVLSIFEFDKKNGFIKDKYVPFQQNGFAIQLEPETNLYSCFFPKPLNYQLSREGDQIYWNYSLSTDQSEWDNYRVINVLYSINNRAVSQPTLKALLGKVQVQLVSDSYTKEELSKAKVCVATYTKAKINLFDGDMFVDHRVDNMQLANAYRDQNNRFNCIVLPQT